MRMHCPKVSRIITKGANSCRFLMKKRTCYTSYLNWVYSSRLLFDVKIHYLYL